MPHTPQVQCRQIPIASRLGSKRRKSEYSAIIPHVPDLRKCVVRFRDSDGIEHVIHVEAASLYEAGCVALRQFRRSDWSREALLKSATLQVEVWQAPAVYKIGVDLLDRWLARSSGSPREIALRQKIRARLGEPPRT